MKKSYLLIDVSMAELSSVLASWLHSSVFLSPAQDAACQCPGPFQNISLGPREREIVEETECQWGLVRYKVAATGKININSQFLPIWHPEKDPFFSWWKALRHFYNENTKLLIFQWWTSPTFMNYLLLGYQMKPRVHVNLALKTN